MEYIFKYDSIEYVFDDTVCFMYGIILGRIRNMAELKKWYVKGNKHKPKPTILIIEMIKAGLSDAEIIASNEMFAFWNIRKIKEFRAAYMKTVKFVPITVAGVADIDALGVHRSAAVYSSCLST